MRVNKYIIMAVLLLLCFFSKAQDRKYQGKMHVTPTQLEQIGDSLYVKLRFDISGINVDSRRSISLFPVILDEKNRIELAEVMVKGRNNYKTHTRRVALMNKKERAVYDSTAPYAVLKGYRSKDTQLIEYAQVIPYQAWMADARMDVQQDVCGCGKPARMLSVAQVKGQVNVEVLIEPYQVLPALAYVRPQAEMVKRREMSGEAFLDFIVNKIDIRPDYMNNPRELKKITDMLKEVYANKNITVKSISVIGYASPEGRLESNKWLSEGRANALVRYLVPRFDYPRSLYKIEYGGENWKGLKDYVEMMDWSHKYDILDILKTYDAENSEIQNAACKASLKKLSGGEPYKYLLKEVYPSLRVAICKLEYVVKGFDVLTAKELIYTRPQDLSLNEMFLVANTFENGSQEFIDIFELAVRMYPNSKIANLNAASAALARNDIRSAERYLEKAKTEVQIPELDNALGVFYMLKGEYDEAERYLHLAADKGLDVAKSNLLELAKKIENVELIKKQKRNIEK